MGQYWEFLNIDKREGVSRVGGAKQMEFFSCKQRPLVLALTVPYPSTQAEKWLVGVHTQPRSEDKGILRFPNELLLNVLQHCSYLTDKVSLAITCRRMLSLSLGHIEETKKKRVAPWAGDRLICTGDYAEWNRLPPKMLTEDERKEIKALDDKSRYPGGYGGLGFMRDTKAVLYTGALHDKYIKRFAPEDRKRFEELYVPQFPVREDWVLCNLTRGLYVRASAIAALSKGPSAVSPLMPKRQPDLGHALVTQICWTSDPSGCVIGNQGRWAGNRFCITTLDRIPSPPEGKEWVDVSGKLVRCVENVWSEY